MIGKTLSHFKITAKLGEGGMGEVYRAEDTRLGREVAIKVLPEPFMADPERLARFEREAKVLASLNHPNIAGIHQVEEAQGVHFLVMELVEGETLDERLERGSMPLDEALPIALQIAEALGAAHEQGIIHRDLKPANVKLTLDDQVKVLDFGLAKAWEGPREAGPDLSASPTLTAQMTQAGVILGTAAYMSPEQARGQAVDGRTDVWALGCVLYEMLAGHRAFPGDTASDALVAVLGRDPDWGSLPALPSHIERLLRHCLEKDLRRRWRDLGDATIELQATASDTWESREEGAAARPAYRAVVAAAILAALVTGLLVWSFVPRPRPRVESVKRFVLDLPADYRLRDAWDAPITMSPDGTRLVYVALTSGEPPRLVLRELDSFEQRDLPGTVGAEFAFFSPDGLWVGFWRAGGLFKVSVSGGQLEKIGDVPDLRGASWGSRGQIVLGGSNTGLLTIDADGGEARLITQPDGPIGQTYHAWPELLPDDDHVLFTVKYEGAQRSGTEIAVLSLESAEWRELPGLEDATQAHYLESGHLVFFRHDQLLAMPFDESTAEPLGPASVVVEDLFVGWNSGLYLGYFAVSRSGNLAYAPGDVAPGDERLILVDRQGNTERLPVPSGRYTSGVALAPDGDRVALEKTHRLSSDIWVFDTERGAPTRLTFAGANILPVWSPDGTRIYFAAQNVGTFDLYSVPADGSSEPRLLLDREFGVFPTAVSGDGALLAFTEQTPETGSDLYLLPLEQDSQPRPLAATPFLEGGAAFSPDGRFLTFFTDESGQKQVYAMPLAGGGKVPISTDGGSWPRWSRDGTEIFYMRGSTLMAVDVALEPDIRVGTTRPLFDVSSSDWYDAVYGHGYDVTPDGRHFVIVESKQAELTQLNVVLDWMSEIVERTSPD